MKIIILCSFISFFSTFFLTKFLIKFLEAAKIFGIDMHKKKQKKLPTSGGVCVAAGILAGLLSFIGIQTFVYGLQLSSIPILAVISSVLIVTFVGLLDDLNVKSKKVKIKGIYDIRVGFPQWIKPLLTLPAAIPLMVISAGETNMTIPFLGKVEFGTLYPLALIPFGVVGASNAVNLLGGFNGIEAGMGVVYMLSLGIYSLPLNQNSAAIFLFTAASLIAFLKYNSYPAKILPGDSLTYLLGSVVASGVIVGNMERAGILALLPFILEFFLKARSRFKASCLGKIRKDGTLAPPYGKKIYSLTHIVMNIGRFTEKQITFIFILIEALACSLIFLNF